MLSCFGRAYRSVLFCTISWHVSEYSTCHAAHGALNYFRPPIIGTPLVVNVRNIYLRKTTNRNNIRKNKIKMF